MPIPLYDLDEVLTIHEAALDYSVMVQQASSQKTEGEKTNLVARSATSVLMHEIVCLHRAIKGLCFSGWAFATPILLRSMLEGTLSFLVIANAGRPDVAAFKYFYAYARTTSDGTPQDPKIAKEAQENIAIHMAQMEPEDQGAARAFLQEPARGPFWYSDTFRGPTAIIKKYSSGAILDLYTLLSSAAHVGFIGSRIFRDNPDTQDINPRRDSRATGFALISSSKILAEATRAREKFEGLDVGRYEAVVAIISEIKPVG